jgi:hypothetical protein
MKTSMDDILEKKYPSADVQRVYLPEQKPVGAKRHTTAYMKWFKFKKLCRKAIEYGIDVDSDGCHTISGTMPVNYSLPDTLYRGRLIRAFTNIYKRVSEGKAPLGYMLDNEYMLPRGTGHSLLYFLCEGGLISREFAGYMYHGIPIYKYDITEDQKAKWKNFEIKLQVNRLDVLSKVKETVGTTIKKLELLDYSKDEERKPSKKTRSHKINTTINDISIDTEKIKNLSEEKSLSFVRLEAGLRPDTILRVGFREYSVLTNMRKKERACLKLDGEEICEGADMPLGSFTVLINSIIKASKHLPIVPDKRTRTEAYVLASNIMSKEDPKNSLIELLGAVGYRGKSPGDQIKGWIRNWITKRREWSEYIDKKGTKRVAVFKGNKLSEYIKNNFPSLYYFIGNLQKVEWGKYNNKTMYELLEYLEFQSMRKLLCKYKGIRVHDAIYCKVSDANAVKNSMYRELGVRRKFDNANILEIMGLHGRDFDVAMKGA